MGRDEMMTSGIPIIGQTRTWKDLRFVASPIAKDPSILVPGAKPTILGWQVGLLATRSDDCPCNIGMVIDVTKIGSDPLASMFKMFGVLVTNLESYRTCNCLPGHPCEMHTPNTSHGRPS